MLIVTSKSPGWGKQKPQQWGPLSSVRSAVFRNAEQMGIDPAYIMANWFFYELTGSSTRRVSGGVDTIDYPKWGADGLWVDRADEDRANIFLADDMSVNLIDKTAYTLMSTAIYSGDEGSYKRGLFCNYYASREKLDFYKSDYSDTFKAVLGHNYDDIVVTLETPTALPKFVNVTPCLRRKSLTDHALFIDGVKVAEDTTTDMIAVETSTLSDVNIGSHTAGTLYTWDGVIKSVSLFSAALTDNQIYLLGDAPFRLLQPNPTPLIFDWGAGGGTTIPLSSGGLLVSKESVGVDISRLLLYGDVGIIGSEAYLYTPIELMSTQILAGGKKIGIDTSKLLSSGVVSLVGNNTQAMNSIVVDLSSGVITFTNELVGMSISVELAKGLFTIKGKNLLINNLVVAKKISEIFSLNFNLWG